MIQALYLLASTSYRSRRALNAGLGVLSRSQACQQRVSQSRSAVAYQFDVQTDIGLETKQFHAMRRSFLNLKKKISTSSLLQLDRFRDEPPSTTIITRTTQQGSLALPTQLDRVVEAAHKGAIKYLPGENASEDEVRYFLYQVLTLAKYKICLYHPQWVLETCMFWKGNGRKLRSMTANDFQLVCPITSSHATIDWSVKCSSFKLEQLPPSTVRLAIAELVQDVVTGLKRKEVGNRRSGWQVSNEPQETATLLPEGMGKMSTFTPQQAQMPSVRFLLPPPAPLPAKPFLNFNNQALPHLHQIPDLDLGQASMYVQDRTPTNILSPQMSGPMSSIQEMPNSNFYRSASPTSSYCQTDSFSSRLTETTTGTSPSVSKSEANCWTPDIGRSRSIPPLIPSMHDRHTLPGPYQIPIQHMPTASPNQYKKTLLSPTIGSSGPSFYPARHYTHLRSGSHPRNITAFSPSEAYLTSSEGVPYEQGLRQNSTMSPDMIHPSSYRHASLFPEVSSNTASLSSTRSFVTAPVYERSIKESFPNYSASARRMKSTPMMRARTVVSPPNNNCKIDANTLDTAERASLKTRPSLERTRLTEQERQQHLNRRKSEHVLSHRMHTSRDTLRNNEEPSGPSMRTRHPQRGLPRLPIYETIEERLRNGDVKLQSELHSVGRPLTMIERIEQREMLEGKPQRGADTGPAAQKWMTYF